MLWKAIKLAVVTVGGSALAAGFIFGTDLGSYVRSTFSSTARAVKGDIPVDFQIQRARDLLADTGPEIQKNVRLMAEEGVHLETEMIWLRSYGNARTGSALSVLAAPSDHVKGKHVLLIDGVLDKGHTIARSTQLLKDAGAASTLNELGPKVK